MGVSWGYHGGIMGVSWGYHGGKPLSWEGKASKKQVESAWKSGARHEMTVLAQPFFEWEVDMDAGQRLKTDSAGRLHHAIDQEHLLTVALGRLDFELRGVGQNSPAQAVNDGWSGAAAENLRAHGEVQFVHEVGAK